MAHNNLRENIIILIIVDIKDNLECLLRIEYKPMLIKRLGNGFRLRSN